MKFICLKYLDKVGWEASPAAERQGIFEAGLAYDNSLREAGHFFATEALQTDGQAVGLRSCNGQLIVEGELAIKARPRLSGLMFLEARDLNHAIMLIANHPGMKLGWFEIHPAEEGRSQ